MPNTKNTHRYHPNTHSRGIPVIVRTHTHTNDTVSDVNNTKKAMTVFETVITNKESNCGAGYWPANNY